MPPSDLPSRPCCPGLASGRQHGVTVRLPSRLCSARVFALSLSSRPAGFPVLLSSSVFREGVCVVTGLTYQLFFAVVQVCTPLFVRRLGVLRVPILPVGPDVSRVARQQRHLCLDLPQEPSRLTFAAPVNAAMCFFRRVRHAWSSASSSLLSTPLPWEIFTGSDRR